MKMKLIASVIYFTSLSFIGFRLQNVYSLPGLVIKRIGETVLGLESILKSFVLVGLKVTETKQKGDIRSKLIGLSSITHDDPLRVVSTTTSQNMTDLAEICRKISACLRR